MKKLVEFFGRLREIYDPPIVLSVRGNIKIFSRPAIAVMGTRHPTPHGTGMAGRLATYLAARRLVIISGMARGADTSAHRGTIVAKGRPSPFSAPVLMSTTRKNTGARVTARCDEQGRDVYAVPGNVTNKNSWGPNTLIKARGEAGRNRGRRLGRTTYGRSDGPQAARR